MEEMNDAIVGSDNNPIVSTMTTLTANGTTISVAQVSPQTNLEDFEPDPKWEMTTLEKASLDHDEPEDNVPTSCILSQTSMDAHMEKVIDNIVELGGCQQFAQTLESTDAIMNKEDECAKIQKEIIGDERHDTLHEARGESTGDEPNCKSSDNENSNLPEIAQQSSDLRTNPTTEPERGSTDEQAKKTQVTADSPQATMEKPQPSVEEPRVSVEEPHASTEKPQTSVEELHKLADEPQASVVELQAATEEPQALVEEADASDEKLQESAETPQELNEEPQAPVPEPQVSIKEPQEPVEKHVEPADEPQELIEEPEASPEKLQELVEEPETPTEDAQPLVQKSQAPVEEPEAPSEETHDAIAEPEAEVEEPQAPAEEPQPPAQESQESAKDEAVVAAKPEAQEEQPQAPTMEAGRRSSRRVKISIEAREAKIEKEKQEKPVPTPKEPPRKIRLSSLKSEKPTKNADIMMIDADRSSVNNDDHPSSNQDSTTRLEPEPETSPRQVRVRQARKSAPVESSKEAEPAPARRAVKRSRGLDTSSNKSLEPVIKVGAGQRAASSRATIATSIPASRPAASSSMDFEQKKYTCITCNFSTERIDNIIIHRQKNCKHMNAAFNDRVLSYRKALEKTPTKSNKKHTSRG